jgi:hypothetical protein
MKYDIYYQDPYVHTFILHPEAQRVTRDRYKKVASIECADLETLFRAMNHDAFHNVIGKMYPQLRSMSVGDVAVDENGVGHLCCSLGWRDVEFKA